MSSSLIRTVKPFATVVIAALVGCSQGNDEGYSFGKARLNELGVDVADVDTVQEQAQDSLQKQPTDFQVKSSQGAQTLQRATFFLKNYLGRKPEFKITPEKDLMLLRASDEDTNRLCEVRRSEGADILRYRIGCVSLKGGKRLDNLERSIAKFIQSGEMDLNTLD